MSPVLLGMLITWGAVTAVFLVLFVYRSTLTMHEEDQLFLGETEANMQKEQTEIIRRVERVSPFVTWLGATSGVMILVIAGFAVYQGLTQAQ